MFAVFPPFLLLKHPEVLFPIVLLSHLLGRLDAPHFGNFGLVLFGVVKTDVEGIVKLDLIVLVGIIIHINRYNIVNNNSKYVIVECVLRPRPLLLGNPVQDSVFRPSPRLLVLPDPGHKLGRPRLVPRASQVGPWQVLGSVRRLQHNK